MEPPISFTYNKGGIWSIFLLIFLCLFSFLAVHEVCLAQQQKPRKVKEVEVVKNEEYFFQVNSAIEKAENSIKVIAFEMGYYPEHPLSPSNILIRNLIAAEERGVEVKIILERSDWNQRVDKKNKQAASLLSPAGVKVRFDSPSVTTHAKLVIADSRAILGSNNWTYYSLTQNNELALLVTTPSVIKDLEQYFNNLWEKCTPP